MELSAEEQILLRTLFAARLAAKGAQVVVELRRHTLGIGHCGEFGRGRVVGVDLRKLAPQN